MDGRREGWGTEAGMEGGEGCRKGGKEGCREGVKVDGGRQGGTERARATGGGREAEAGRQAGELCV